MPPTRRGGRQRAGTRSTSARCPITTTATRPFGFVSAAVYSAVLVFAFLAWASQGAFSIPIKSAAAAAIATPTTAAAPTARKASPVTASSYASSASRLFASAPSGDSGGDGSTTPPGSSGASRSADGGVRPSRVVPSPSQQLPRPPGGGGGGSNGVNASTNSRNDGPDNYHLLWSPRFWKKAAATTGALFLGRYLLLSSAPTAAIVDGACHHAAAAAAAASAATATATTAATTATAAATGSSHRLLLGPAFRNLVLPMFASACCLLQLILNALVGGCAGFNKYLGPTRPYMLSLLLFLTLTGGVPTTTTATTAATTVMTSAPTPLRTVLTTHAWRWGLALLPEALHLWNARIGHYRKSRILKEQQQEVDLEDSITKHDRTTLDPGTVHHLDADGTKQMKDKEDFLVTTTEVVEATVQIHIPTMGCVACINNIDSSLWNAGKDWMPHKGAEQEQSTVPSTTAVRIKEAASALYHPLTDGPGKKGGYAMIKFDLITTKAKTNPDTNKPEASSSSSSRSSSSMKGSDDTSISVNDVVDTLVQAIDKAGFGDGCTVESVTVRNK